MSTQRIIVVNADTNDSTCVTLSPQQTITEFITLVYSIFARDIPSYEQTRLHVIYKGRLLHKSQLLVADKFKNNNTVFIKLSTRSFIPEKRRRIPAVSFGSTEEWFDRGTF
ncbi:Ubiquitin-like_domain superfamily [Hexamita inflata]|uniref:Ubiquitin-like domain superfamily n=1 Tax=Hexamita inflata TaxID=28002 RepID=A0AA86V2L2_9EUKA|nr:Ubiquitin-like domain superfamily [Hexamita inflata]